MKAAVLVEPRCLRVQSITEPVVGPGAALLAILWLGAGRLPSKARRQRPRSPRA